ncbi:DgyrCDS14122 [Dimorphilus gyrociliatus]|uniref:DgyrCDS14122 n=1 Tax=Dimorphilus gyrociliatus TaxID=2664684 RepID=A0A7I8WCQ7_9ANNE|nr:DgyrCDS14122 [Dimorphilus gyrociliatus]
MLPYLSLHKRLPKDTEKLRNNDIAQLKKDYRRYTQDKKHSHTILVDVPTPIQPIKETRILQPSFTTSPTIESVSQHNMRGRYAKKSLRARSTSELSDAFNFHESVIENKANRSFDTMSTTDEMEKEFFSKTTLVTKRNSLPISNNNKLIENRKVKSLDDNTTSQINIRDRTRRRNFQPFPQKSLNADVLRNGIKLGLYRSDILTSATKGMNH